MLGLARLIRTHKPIAGSMAWVGFKLRALKISRRVCLFAPVRHQRSSQGPRPIGYRHSATSSRDARTCSFTILVSSRSCARCPPFQALRLTRSLPSSVVGPVDCSHGFQRLMASACRCLRSNVQPLTMICLQ